MTTKQLNNMKLWELGELALKDLEWCEKQEDIVVNMSEWVMPGDGSVCHVCLAGSVLYRELRWRKVVYRDIPPFAQALDFLRNGDTAAALVVLGRPIRRDLTPPCEQAYYDEDPVAFKAWFRAFMLKLKEADV